MKTHSYLFLLISGLFILSGCGEPNEPDTIDVSGNYKIVKKLPTPGFAQDLVIHDSRLYISQGEGGLLIVDISEPEMPEIITQLTEEVRGYSTKICFKDSLVYLSAGSFGVTVVNVSDVINPFVTVSNLNMKPAKNLFVTGNYLFTAISEQGVKIAELSYPEQPDIRGSLSVLGYACGITRSIDTTRLFVACGEMGFSILDITDFQDGYPETVPAGWCDTPGYAEDVVLDESRSLAFIASGTAGLQIIDYADTTNIHIVGSISPGGYAKELIYSNGMVYMTTGKSGLQVIDVSVVSSPVLAGSVDTEYALGMAMDDKYLYIADELEGLIVISKP
ncbi:MAG: LVIVD repeat-containing protein [Lentimicrobium sp.]